MASVAGLSVVTPLERLMLAVLDCWIVEACGRTLTPALIVEFETALAEYARTRPDQARRLGEARL